MRTGLLISLGLAVLGVLAVWLAFGGVEPLPARFTLDQCHQVALRHGPTGRLVKGAADMAVLPDGETLAVAAIDRGDRHRPFGGLFAVSLFDLAEGTSEVEVEELVPSYALVGGVRPEGLALDSDGRRLALVNRVGPEAEIVIDVLTRRGDAYRRDARYRHDAFCRAHDLTFDLDGTLFITREGAGCAPGIRDYLPWSASGLLLSVTPEGRLTADEARYARPTGIAIGPTGAPVVADMLAGELSGASGGTPVPGAPDKLTVDDTGSLVAAVHPSLWLLTLYSNGLAFSSPSRIVRADPEGTGLEVLFDDPDGALMSAASVGVVHEDRLYMGSLYDSGIVVCEDG